MFNVSEVLEEKPSFNPEPILQPRIFRSYRLLTERIGIPEEYAICAVAVPILENFGADRRYVAGQQRRSFSGDGNNGAGKALCWRSLH